MTKASTFYGGSGLKPPTSLVTSELNDYQRISASVYFCSKKAYLTGNTAGTSNFVTLLDLTSSEGIVELVAVASRDTTTRTIGLKITIDGTVVYNTTTGSVSTNWYGLCPIGGGHEDSDGIDWVGPGQIRFNDSFKIEVSSSVGSETTGVQLFYRYYLT